MEKSNPLDRWLKLKKKDKASLTIVRKSDDEPPVLSFGQERLWFLHHLFPESPAYHFSETLRIKGHLDIDRLKLCIEGVISRHDVLRTTYSLEEGSIVQQVSPDANLGFTNLDMQGVPSEKRFDEVIQKATKLAREPIDLKSGPLIRLTVFRLGKEDHLLLITFHHILIDAWSMPIFWSQVTALNNNTPLPDPPLQFADFSKWQRNNPINEKSLAYWKNKLKDIEPVNLPTDFPRPAVPLFEGKLISQSIPNNLLEKLQQLARETETTLFMVLTTAFKILLSKYSGGNDIAVGTPFANRGQSELEQMIGFFVNTMVLRSDLSGNPGFYDFLKSVKSGILDAFSNNDIPFEKLVDELKPSRSLNQNPLFSTMLIYRQINIHPLDLPGLDIESILLDTGVSKFDLSLFVDEEENNIKATFEYNTNLFKPSTIKRMLGHYQALLENIVEHPERPIGSLTMLTFPEREKILSKWNKTSTSQPDVEYIHHWIEEHAGNSPDKIAVVANGKTLSYGELNQKASKLANYLIKEGAGPNIPIGICTDRSIEMVIGLLAVLKAGSAYLPIDPAYPEERKAFMLKDAEAPILLTQLNLAGELPNTKAKQIFIDGRIPPGIEEGTNSAKVKHGDLAYIIFTSGSTGRPKGVPVSHKNLVYSTFARFEYYPTSPDCFLLLSSFGFDSSIVGIFWTLCSGGKLLLSGERSEQDMYRLSLLIADHKVTHTLLLPSLYDILLQQAPPMNLGSLTTVIVAGEVCPSSLVKLHNLVLPNVDLYNEYGPTEASVWSTVHKTGLTDINRPVPIGRPVPHSKNYILGKNMGLVPIGIPGELYIGGTGVTGQYLNRPELTAERFIPNPFGEDPGDLLYKTGDMAFYQSDGLIGFLGRADQQVKIRGYRIELEEIKEIIKENEAVSDAIVIIQTTKKAGEEKVSQLESTLKDLEAEEADRLLRFVEMLSEEKLDYLLSQIEKPEKTPSA